MSDAPMNEESWEGEISALLAGLPEVEPPDGFIDRAINHRPLFAGRIALGLALLAAGALAGSAALDVFGPRSVEPELATMAQQHEMVASGFFAGLGSTPEAIFERVEVDEPLTPVTLPAEVDRAGDFVAANLRQAAYGSGDHAVSVFAEAGDADWSSLPPGERLVLGGLDAWYSAESEVVVLQAGDSVVTVVGLDPGQVEELLVGVEDGSTNRLVRMANALAASIGFPEL